MLAEDPRCPSRVADFLSARRLTSASGLPTHVQHAMRDVPYAWNLELERTVSRSPESNYLMAQILTSQALVTLQKAATERNAEIERDKAARARYEEMAAAYTDLERKLGDLETQSAVSLARAEAAEKRVIDLEAERSVAEKKRVAELESLRATVAAESFRRGEEKGRSEAQEAASGELKKMQIDLLDAIHRASTAESKEREAEGRAVEQRQANEEIVRKLTEAQSLVTKMQEAEAARATGAGHEADPRSDPVVIGEFAFYMAFTDAIRETRKAGRPSDHLESYFRRFVTARPLHPDISVRFRDLEETYGVDLSWYPNRARLLLPDEDSVEDDGGDGGGVEPGEEAGSSAPQT